MAGNFCLWVQSVGINTFSRTKPDTLELSRRICENLTVHSGHGWGLQTADPVASYALYGN